MKIYIDNDYKCHIVDDGSMTAVETNFFEGKCAAFVEGYRFVPEGETWTRADGVEFSGEMITTWKDYKILKAYQEQYEEMLPEQEKLQTALNILVGEET